MGSRDPRGLSAHAGPRITAATPVSRLRFFFEREAVSRDSYTFHIRTATHFGFDSFAQFLPWPLIREIHPRPRFFGFCVVWAGAAALSGALFPWLWTLLPVGFLAWTIQRERDRDARKSREILRELSAQLDCGLGLAELRPSLERAVQLDADNDAARLLLSCTLLEAGEDVSTLLQLAPLRDHHPQSGEVLLMAAATYLHLHRPADAFRMLEALTIRPSHAAYLAARHMLEECRMRLDSMDGNELPLWGSPLAEQLQPEA
jgi:hypothetical protein